MFYEPEQCIIWLLIGYYAKIDDIADAQSFHRFYRQFINSGLVSKSCRLYGFSADGILIEELRKPGINELLCVNVGRTSYGISSEVYGEWY